MRATGRSMRRRAASPMRIVAAVVAVSLIGIGCQATPPPSPTVSATPRSSPTGSPTVELPPTSPLVVSLDRSGGGTTAHLGYPVDLSAAALGMSGIAALELWAGGNEVELTPSPDPQRPAASAQWEWTPTTVGDTILVARAFDAAGRSSQSAPVRLHVVADPPVSYTLVEVPAAAGETLDAIVAAHGGDVMVAPYWNEDLPAGPLAAGTTVAVPVRDPTPPKPTATTSSGSPTLIQARTATNVTQPVPGGLATPDLSLSVKDCVITSTASGTTPATDGLAFSVLPPVSDGFVPLPPIGAKGGGAATSFAALGGTNYVMVSAYTSEASAPSAIVAIDVPATCSSGWTGSARLDAGKLVSSQGADRAYLYLKVGDADWQRVPAGAGTFVTAIDGELDFGSVLPVLGNASLSLEAWGWSSGKLVALGEGAYTPPATPLYLGAAGVAARNPIGLGTTLDIQTRSGSPEFPEQLTRDSTIDRPGPNSTSGLRTFKWTTSTPGVTALQWQLLPYPLANATTPEPPFLLDTGTIDVQGLTTGYFSLDLKPYLDGESKGVTSASAWGQSQLIATLSRASAYQTGGGSASDTVKLNPGGIFKPSPTPGQGSGAVPGGTSNLTLGSADSLSHLTIPINALYLRVIPYIGTTPAGDASNLVSLKVVEPDDPVYLDTSPPPPPPSYHDAYSQHAIFYAPTGSDPHYFHCVRVVKGGYSLPVWGNWSNGTTHCKPEDDGGWSLADAFDSFVEWVGDVWDWVTEAYSWVEDQVVNVVLALVPCQQIADQVSDSGKEICRTIAKTGLQAVMVSFGIPPEIPNWESTVNAAKGDLKDFILENADQLPGVSDACSAAQVAHAGDGSFPTCDALVEKVIDEATSRIAAQRSKTAASNAGVVVPPGITVEPDPRSTPQPPHFDVTLTRTNAPLPPDVACTMTAGMTSTLGGWTWNEYKWSKGNATIVSRSGTVTGEPFTKVTQDIARLAPGQSTTYQLWLTKKSTWFEPDGFNDFYAQQYYQWDGELNHGWVLLQKGAAVTGSLSGNCIPGGTSNQVLTGQASQ